MRRVAAVAYVSLLLLQASTAAKPKVDSDSRDAAVGDARRFVRFEENRGQVAPEVDFIARTSGYTLFLTSRGALFAVLARPSSASVRPLVSYLSMSFVGADESAPASGEQLLPSRSNYLIGRDAARWQRDIAHFGRVRYRDLYRGIDLLYRAGSEAGGLEYDLIVRPGANPAAVRFRLAGADAIRIDRDGNLDVSWPNGRVVQRAPNVYQEFGAGRRALPGRFRIADSNVVGFELGRYDTSRDLIIDPLVLVYSTYVGGSGSETASGLAVDRQGMAYVTGQTFSADFPSANGLQSAPSCAESSLPAEALDAWVPNAPARFPALPPLARRAPPWR